MLTVAHVNLTLSYSLCKSCNLIALINTDNVLWLKLMHASLSFMSDTKRDTYSYC